MTLHEQVPFKSPAHLLHLALIVRLGLGFDASYHLRIEAGGPRGRAAAAGPDTAHSQIVRIW